MSAHALLTRSRRPARLLHRSMIGLAVAFGCGFVAPAASAQSNTHASSQSSDTVQVDEEIRRNTDEWQLAKRTNLAIDGYDPVAYFPEGGGKATKGDAKITERVGNVVYRFANAANRDRFRANPHRYEPAHGGWCSWAMAQEGSKTKPDAKNFIVKDDRLYLFYKGLFADTRKDWQRGDHASLERSADRSWKRVAGEDARRVKARD